MNILHIGKYYPPYYGGMETYLQDLTRQQVKDGHQVSVLVHNHQHGWLYSSTETTSDNGVNVIRQSSLRPLLFTPLMLGLGKSLNKLFTESPPDLIHISWPNPSALLLLLNRQAKSVPWILQWHSDMVTQHSSWLLKFVYRLFKPFEKTLINRCHTIVTSSTAYAEYSPALKHALDKTRTIAIGIDTENISSAHKKAQVSDHWFKTQQGLKIFSLGRLTFYKNHQLLLKVLQQHPDWQLVIAGQGPEHKKLSESIQQWNLSDRVKLTGSLKEDDVHALYQSCDVFCLASNDRAESYGLVLLEAMAHDCIVVGPNTPGSGMQYLVEQYNKGFVFDNDDVESLSTTLQSIQNTQQAIHKKNNNFNLQIANTAELNAALYTEILKKSTGEES
ncbi:glycosyltransferase [Marinicella sp. W31]|uniref:glycosyltransferase n=1 Tax=Marinicella sp. W31 TaxID=3023713 RepID=UPI0037576073